MVEHLAQDLQAEFVGTKGFSTSNLWRMQQFYETYVDNQKLAPLVREISWSHNVVILGSCKDDLEREFYLRMAKKHSWSRNVLVHKIEGKTYEKTLTAQTNFDTLPSEISDSAKLVVKDEYMSAS